MGISVVLAAMPAASTTAILAAKYGGDEVFCDEVRGIYDAAFDGVGTGLVYGAAAVKSEL